MPALQLTRPANRIAWTDTYHNGGVEGRALAEWYRSHFADVFDATDFSACLPEATTPPAPDSAPAAGDICAACQLCTDGSIYRADPAEPQAPREPGVTFACDLLKRLRAGDVDQTFATRAVQDARAMQTRAIDAFVTVMPDHFGTLHPATALDAEEHYVLGRDLGVTVNPVLRKNAWFHFDTYRGFIRTNFDATFLER